MSKKKLYEEDISIMEAVDNLSSIAELNPEEVEAEKGEERTRVLKWLSPKKSGDELAEVKRSFKAVHNYLKKVYSKDPSSIKDQEMQRGIHAIMTLAGEAVEKIDKCSSLFARAHGLDMKLSSSKEYQELQKFYHDKIIKRFKESLESEDAWLAEWAGEKDVKDVEQVGLKDLETVKRDREYELFYLLDDEGKPFYNKNLLRHIKLVADFDEIAFSEMHEDPLLKVKVVQDKDVHETAKEVIEAVDHEIKRFYQDALKFKEHQMVCYLNMAMMALLMASHDRHLMKQTYGKTCLSYFSDFQFYLREALTSPQYAKTVEMSDEERDSLLTATLDLLHSTCHALFLRRGLKSDMGAFVYNLIHTAEQHEQVKHKGSILSFFTHLLECHDDIENVLRKYPNGPLFKTLDVFRDQESNIGFDPYRLENLPSRVYDFGNKNLGTTVLRMACPTKQERIDQAYVIEEFVGLLRSLSTRREKKKLLVFNFQDRTNWKEFSRCEAIESLQSDAEFSKHIWVVTLPKNTDFYLQVDEYIRETDAKNFIKQLTEQVESFEECGFSFPRGITKKEIHAFVSKLIPLIHSHFFDEKEILTRKNRLDFIEIFFHFLQLKVIDIIKPEYTTFLCKDSLDTGAAATASFFGFTKIISNDASFSEEDKDLMLWMVYAPSLFVRERPIDIQRLNRLVSFLTISTVLFEEKRSKIIKDLEPLFEKGTFDTLVTSSN